MIGLMHIHKTWQPPRTANLMIVNAWIGFSRFLLVAQSAWNASSRFYSDHVFIWNGALFILTTAAMCFSGRELLTQCMALPACQNGILFKCFGIQSQEWSHHLDFKFPITLKDNSLFFASMTQNWKRHITFSLVEFEVVFWPRNLKVQLAYRHLDPRWVFLRLILNEGLR